MHSCAHHSIVSEELCVSALAIDAAPSGPSSFCPMLQYTHGIKSDVGAGALDRDKAQDTHDNRFKVGVTEPCRLGLLGAASLHAGLPSLGLSISTLASAVMPYAPMAFPCPICRQLGVQCGLRRRAVARASTPSGPTPLSSITLSVTHRGKSVNIITDVIRSINSRSREGAAVIIQEPHLPVARTSEW